MPQLMPAPPTSSPELVVEVLHGVSVADPFRWLEDQDSGRTRQWLEEQAIYARNYFDEITGREKIRGRVTQLLDVEGCDSVHKVGSRYFFRKRLPMREQFCIFMREGLEGDNELLVDPLDRGTGKYTAVKPLSVSRDGRLLLYEVKQGGERTGSFEILDVVSRRTLKERLPRGYLRSFAFSPDNNGFYYVHEKAGALQAPRRAAYQHILGTPFSEDREIFSAGDDSSRVRLFLLSEGRFILFVVQRYGTEASTDAYRLDVTSADPPETILLGCRFRLGLRLVNGRIFAMTDWNAPNQHIVEIQLSFASDPVWIDVIPECPFMIHDWQIAGDHIVVQYLNGTSTQLCVFDLAGCKIGEIPVAPEESIRLLPAPTAAETILFQAESFTKPKAIFECSKSMQTRAFWSRSSTPFQSSCYSHIRVQYPSKDGTSVPMFIVGRRDVLEKSNNPTILTAYGGFGVTMTPQFSVLVAFLMEQGCLFALPNIRGGSEFGVQWRNAAKRRERQKAFDDFLCAAEWLVASGRTATDKLAIFGASNAGLLVGVALTQRPDLFRAVLCMVPLLDMLRYHLFDEARIWKEELGSADDRDDFVALAGYSPYHKVKDNARYPAVMLISGDADQNCSPIHARKMTARLQAATASSHPILLDYSKHRGHSPVLPLSDRIQALTDRLAFLCHELDLPAVRGADA